MTQVQLSARLVESFAGVFLSPMYDSPAPTPPFHREGWKLYCSDVELAGVIAPRGHAKSTAFTHDYVLANVLFRVEPYVIIVSATEDLAKDHLGDIAKVLREDDDVRSEFHIVDMPVDAKTEIVVRFSDGYECRILAKGAGQKMRGLKWKGRRPGLIICDDLEEDEQVESLDRRKKFAKWFFRALLPCRRKGGKVRFHGTILHEDSLLSRLRGSSVWSFLFYKAHKSFDDFSEILWPELHSEARLREVRQGYIDIGDASGYSQEYLNDPRDSSEAYLKDEWFIEANERQLDADRIVGVGVDFAISKADRANRTSFTVGGMSTAGDIMPMDQRVGRMDSEEIIEEFFSIEDQWHPAFFRVERGQIWLALSPMLRSQMMARRKYLNIVEALPIKDKAARARPLQRRMKIGAVVWPTKAHWYEGMKDEMLHFTGVGDAKLDDQFDSCALMVAGFEEMPEVDEEDFVDDAELAERAQDPRASQGRNPITGY